MEISEEGVDSFLVARVCDGDDGQLRLRLATTGPGFCRGELRDDDGSVSSHIIDMSLSVR